VFWNGNPCAQFECKGFRLPPLLISIAIVAQQFTVSIKEKSW
jgi:hypothetical protein